MLNEYKEVDSWCIELKQALAGVSCLGTNKQKLNLKYVKKKKRKINNKGTWYFLSSSSLELTSSISIKLFFFSDKISVLRLRFCSFRHLV